MFRVALAITVVLAATAHADAPKSQNANRIVFAGLLPLKKPGGRGDLVALKEAQQIRAVLEAALATAAHEPVLGHQGLSDVLGKAYLPQWFDCQNDVSCLGRVLQPVSDQGYRIAITGDYYVKDGVYKIHLASFIVGEGTVSKELRFELASADINDPQKWIASFGPLLASRLGRVRIASNVGDVTCTIDGQPCAFEPDGQTLAAPPGEHAIELGKDEYEPEKVVVNVETGTTQEVAIALKPKRALPQDGRRVSVTGGPRRSPTLTAVRTDKIIEIDGKLDDAAWQKAWVETNFTQHFPDEAKAPTERTELRVLYDDDAIYIGIRCYDAHPDEIVARLTRRDRDIEADKVVVDISSKNDHATSNTFQVNAAGVQVDGTRFNDTDAASDWDAVWYSKTSRDDKGWVAEMKIPLSVLRYNGDTTAFGFQVRRTLQRREEIDEWAYVPRDVQGEVSYYGTLEGLTGLNAKRLFQLSPYDSRRVTFRTQQAPLARKVFGDNVGADLKIGITPALTFDATVNPDFGTVEVDQVVLNLSLTETFFPEKRPFFIEGADLFSTPFTLFYSRRVGRAPPPTRVGGASALLLVPPPDGQILAAGKLTGVLAGRLSIELIDAVTAQRDITLQRDAMSAPETLMVDPLTNFGVVRLRQEFGVNSAVGLTATSVTRNEQRDAIAPIRPDPTMMIAGDKCPVPHGGLIGKLYSADGRCTSDAYAGSLDAVLKTDDGKWGASGQVVGSVLENGPPRLVPDGTLIRPGDLGIGAIAEIGKYGGAHWLYLLRASFMNPRLDLNDAGFNGLANDQYIQSLITLRSTKKALGFLNTSLRLNTRYETAVDVHKTISMPVYGGPTSGTYLLWQATLPNFWSVRLSGGATLPSYNHREPRDGAFLQYPLGWKYGAAVGTDPGKPVIVSMSLDGLRTTRGELMIANLTLNLRPLSFIELDVISDGYRAYGDPKSVDTEPNADGSRTYYFADLDARSFDVLLRGTWTFSPTLSLQTYAQLYVDSGHYSNVMSANGTGPNPLLDLKLFTAATAPDGTVVDFRDSAINVNVFLRWEYLPGSALWLVYTRNQTNVPYDEAEGAGRLRFDRFNGPSTDVLLVKLSYLWEPFH